MNAGTVTIKYRMDENDVISRRQAVSRMSDLICLELKGKCPTWNDVYNALNELPTVEPELLKEQEAVEPVPDYIVRYWRCPKCNWLLISMIDDKCDIPLRRDNYCAKCGRKLKWE